MADTNLAPGLLLASPSLGDPNFERTVILLGHHDDKGALGWVINGDELGPVEELLRNSGILPSGTRLSENPAFALPARMGGPVDRATGWLLYRRGERTMANELLIGPDLAVTGDSDALMSVMQGSGPRDFRLVIGYAGWGPGQLEGEIQQGAWLPAEVDADLIFATPTNSIWEEAYRRSIGTGPAAFGSGRRGQA
jgi:putative transcriptional regulator